MLYIMIQFLLFLESFIVLKIPATKPQSKSAALLWVLNFWEIFSFR